MSSVALIVTSCDLCGTEIEPNGDVPTVFDLGPQRANLHTVDLCADHVGQLMAIYNAADPSRRSGRRLQRLPAEFREPSPHVSRVVEYADSGAQPAETYGVQFGQSD